MTEGNKPRTLTVGASLPWFAGAQPHLQSAKQLPRGSVREFTRVNGALSRLSRPGLNSMDFGALASTACRALGGRCLRVSTRRANIKNLRMKSARTSHDARESTPRSSRYGDEGLHVGIFFLTFGIRSPRFPPTDADRWTDGAGTPRARLAWSAKSLRTPIIPTTLNPRRTTSVLRR